MNPIDAVLNRITMYRLVVYSLGFLAALSVTFSFAGKLAMSPTQLVVSLFLLVMAAYATDRMFARIFKTTTNMESALITALILFLIVQPAHSIASGTTLLLAGIVASASKFLITWNGKHIYNPAALAATVLSLTGLQATTWWIGSSIFWPFTLIVGLAIVRKIRRFPLVLTFVITSIVVQLLLILHGDLPVATTLKHAVLASPLIFLSTIMLTEPATMPPRRGLQIVFAAIVAVLYVTAPGIGSFIVYPEVALLVGNMFAFFVSPKLRVTLYIKEIQQISDRVYNYTFTPERPFRFLAGQYMEWTLTGVPYDSRGNRRSFTIASSPTEPEVHLGVKYYEPASMFKSTLAQLRPGDAIYGSQVAGNFTLRGNQRKKLVFIAGGIGITPFRSMVQDIIDRQLQVGITLIYSVGDPREFAYLDIFRAAEPYGVRLVPVVTDPAQAVPGVVSGKLNAKLIAQLIPDYAERLFYLSGPNAMVDLAKQQLHTLGVTRRHIKTDHFSGY